MFHKRFLNMFHKRFITRKTLDGVGNTIILIYPNLCSGLQRANLCRIPPGSPAAYQPWPTTSTSSGSSSASTRTTATSRAAAGYLHIYISTVDIFIYPGAAATPARWATSRQTPRPLPPGAWTTSSWTAATPNPRTWTPDTRSSGCILHLDPASPCASLHLYIAGMYLNKTNRPMVYSCSWPAYQIGQFWLFNNFSFFITFAKIYGLLY